MKSLGYSVVAIRPSRHNDGTEDVGIVGTVWQDIEPCENHKVYCELSAEQKPEKYGADVRYAVIELVEPMPKKRAAK